MTVLRSPVVLPWALAALAMTVHAGVDTDKATALASSMPRAAAGHGRIYLLSLTGLRIGPGQYIRAFSIKTWGVEILAVCRIPPGWTVAAGNSADPTGKIGGEASLGVTYVNQPRLSRLDRMVLLRLYEPVQQRTIRSGTTEHPATFVGTATIGAYGPTIREHDVRLTYRNVLLVPADHCPIGVT